MFPPTIYIISNFKNGTIYVGVTSNLPKRIYEHKNNIISGFSSKY
ncbi:GIY-YIG nuclease family protein [Candidatus Aquarickettsia rohweri]|nr:GIY-YIG nuclease family protein [Candidatus Aquarickettsia rohweri]